MKNQKKLNILLILGSFYRAIKAIKNLETASFLLLIEHQQHKNFIYPHWKFHVRYVATEPAAASGRCQ